MDPAEGLELAIDMLDFGIEMMRARLRRENPSISEAEIDARIDTWLKDRPGAEYGDGEGIPVAWPRPARRTG